MMISSLPSIITDARVSTVVAIALSIWFMTSRIKKKRAKEDECSWPKVPGSRPFIGNLLSVGGRQHLRGRMEEWADKYGQEKGVYEFNLMGVRYIVACRADIVMEVMSQRPFKFRRPRRLAASVRSIGAEGLFSAEGEEWKADRRVFAPALNKRHVQDYLPTVKLVAGRLVEKWTTLSERGSVVINHDLYKYAMDIISLVAFGRDFDTLRKEDNGDASDVNYILSLGITRTYSPFRYYNIPLIGQYLDGGGWCMKRVLKVFHKLVEDYESTLKEENPSQENADNSQKETFLAKVFAWSQKENTTFSRQRLVGNLLTMFFGGTDSNAASMMTSLWKIADDCSGLQDELASEALALKDFDTNASLDDILTNLPRLRSFYHELLRVMGPFPLIGVEAHEEVHFAGTTLPPGSVVFMLTRYVSTHPPPSNVNPMDKDNGRASSYLEIPLGPNGEGPAEFCPRRWLIQSSGEKNGSDKDSGPFSNVTFTPPKTNLGGFLSFGYGLRICPGKDLAESMALIMLASVLRSFDIISREDNGPIKFITTFSECPDKNIKLILKPRKASVTGGK